MIGKVLLYDDNTDAYLVKGLDGKDYFGFTDEINFKIGDVLYFNCYVIWPGQYETYIMKNIRVATADEKKLILK